MFSLPPLAGSVLARLLDSVLPDFVLAFTFFSALCYAVLGRQFGRQRPAAAMSVALGLALAVGLVWWQDAHGYSMRDLGPIAIFLALVVLAGVVYAAVQHLGGNWAGLSIALAACLLIGSLLGTPWPIDTGLVATLGFVAFIIGVLVYVSHRQVERGHVPPAREEYARVGYDLRGLERDRRVAEDLSTHLRQLRTEADFLITRPDVAGDFMTQLQRLLPEEGWLTQRLAQLRATAHYARAGHLARIHELREMVNQLPPDARAKAAQELAARYTELQLDVRLERLDRAVAEIERRIRELTARAETCVAQHEYPKVEGLLNEAAGLQDHNVKLIKLIEGTEQRLLAAARQLVQQTSGVSGA
jgi:hypothetical protein